jgi:hypothetical protein
LFLQRLTNLERIVRADNFDVKRNGISTAAYPEITGNIQLKAYQYKQSEADTLAIRASHESAESSSNAVAPKPGTGSTGSGGSGR